MNACLYTHPHPPTHTHPPTPTHPHPHPPTHTRRAPKHVSYQMRMAGDFLAQALGMRITTLLDQESHAHHRDMLGLHAQLLGLMSAHGLNPGLRLRALVKEGDAPSLLHLVPGVCGAAVVFGGKTSTVGTVPEAGVLQEVVTAIDRYWLARDRGRAAESWDRIAALLPSDVGGQGLNACAGVLSVPVAEDGQFLLFRPELSTTIRWAGDPSKNARRDANMASGVC